MNTFTWRVNLHETQMHVVHLILPLFNIYGLSTLFTVQGKRPNASESNKNNNKNPASHFYTRFISSPLEKKNLANEKVVADFRFMEKSRRHDVSLARAKNSDDECDNVQR